uniref:Uncharacterized protein n=1 Tax=Rhizophora mucronata TaxID=61149 RepID=A0A2P2QJY1_RHIMU
MILLMIKPCVVFDQDGFVGARKTGEKDRTTNEAGLESEDDEKECHRK